MMAFNIKLINKSIGLYVLIVLGIPTLVTSNVDCGRKPFHCVNATHFMICVDLGGGVSRTIDNYVYECPSPTECQPSNSFECEFPEATTQPSRVSDVTNELLVNNNTTLWSEDTVATISPLTNTSQAIQPEAILTIDVTSTATTNSYTTNDQNITHNASNHTDGLLTNFTQGNMDEKDVLNNDIITNVTTTFDSTTLPVDSMSSSTNMSTEESTTMFTIYTTSEDKINETASTNNILGIENVTETTERVNSSTGEVTSSPFLILNETNSNTDSLSTDIASSTTSGDFSNFSTNDIPPKDNTNKSVISGDALDIINNTENVFSTESEISPNTFVTLPPVTESSEGILTTLVITEGIAITVSTDKSATENQFDYESSAIPITNNINETSATMDGLINGTTVEVAKTTAPTLADSKNVTAIVEPNNLPIDSVTSNNVNINKVETNQTTEATTISTDGLPSTFANQFEHNTDKNYTSNNIGNNKTVSTVDKKPKDNINKSNVSSSALEMKNKSENLSPPKPEVALPDIPVTLPSVMVSSESTITTVVMTEGTAVTISTNATAYNQSQDEGTAITKNISEYYSTFAPSTLTPKIGATDAIEMTTAPFITDIKNDVTTIVEPIDLPVESVTLNNDMITKVTDGASVATDKSVMSTMGHTFEVTTRKYDVSNNVSNNKTVSTIDEHPKNKSNKSEATNNPMEIENRTENVLFTSPEGVLSNISAIIPSITVSTEGPKITLVTTEATSVDNNSASTAYNQSEGEGTAITKNISEYYSTSAPSTLTSKIGATDAIEMTTAPLITDIINDVTTIVEPIDLPVESVTSNKDVITKVTGGASVATDESIKSTMDYIFEVTTRKYDVSNNVSNNKTVSTIEEHPKNNANKSEATNNEMEIENRTENVLFTSPEGVLSNISAIIPSITVSTEGPKITLVTTEATSIDNNSASTAYNQSEGEGTAITKNISEYYSTSAPSTLTSKIGATDAMEMTTTPLITDIINDVTTIAEPIDLPVESVTSNKDVITKVTGGASVATDESIKSTMDYIFEVTTRKYDVSNNVSNNKTVSTIEEHPKNNANKSEATNNAIEIENRTENVLFTSQGVLSNISGTFPSETVSSEGTIITLVTTEATEIITSADNDSASTIYNQSENKSSASTINNNHNFSEHFYTTEALILTSNNVNENKLNQLNVSTTVLTDQSVRSTTDYLFEATTNKYDISDTVTNNKTVSTIEVQPEDTVNKSDVSNNTTEIENRTENGLIIESEAASSNISPSLTPVAASDDATASTAVITEGTTITISIDENLLIVTDKQPEEYTTDVINNISVTNFTTENITSTSQSVTAGPIETIASTIAATKNETATVQPITLPTVTSNDADVNKDLIISVTETIAVSTDQGIRSTIDSQFQVSTNQHTSKVNNNKTESIIDEKLKSNVSNSAIESKNRTENLLPPGSEVNLPIITVTVPSVGVPSESTAPTDVITDNIVTTIYTNSDPGSNMDKRPGHEISVTTIINNTGTYSTSDGITLTTKSNEYKMTTDSIIAPAKNVTPDADPIALPTDSVTSLNSKQDVLSQVTESTIFSKDQSLNSTLDYKFEQITNKNLNSSSQKVTADPIETITVPIIAFTKDEKGIIEPINVPIASVTSNYGNGNQDILITVTETTVISNDQTTRSTIDYKFEENTNQYNIPYNANNKSENSLTTVLETIYLNSIDKNVAVNISNGKVTEKSTRLPLDSITLSLIEASSEGKISAAVDDSKNRPKFESQKDTTIDKNPEFKMSQSDSSINKLQTDKTEINFQEEKNNLQSTEIQSISIPSMKQATDIVYDLTGGAEILLESPTLSTVSPIPTASSQDALLNFNTTNAVHRTDTENKITTYSIDKQHDANATLNINNSAKYAPKPTTVSTNKSTVSAMEGSLNIWTDTANDNVMSTTENKSNKAENLDDLNLTTNITQNTKIPVNSELANTVPLVDVEPVYDVTGSLNSSTHVSNQDTKATTTKIESSISSVANLQPSDNTERTKIYLLPESGVTNTNNKESKKLPADEMTTLAPVVTVTVPVLTRQTDLEPAISASPTSTFTDNKATKKVIDESHFAEKEISVTETNIPTVRDTSSPSYASKPIYTPNSNENTQSFIQNIHEKGSSINNAVTNVIQEDTTKDNINDFNKNNNVISALQTSAPRSYKTNSYKDSNTITTTHKSPSQFSTSQVETAHSVKNSTSTIGQVSNDNPLINIVFNNNNNTNIQPITSLVINETNWNSKINLSLSNSTKKSSEKSLLQQTSNNKPRQHNHDNRNSNKRSEVKFNCNHHRRGRYADQDNCRKFYICIGRLTPIVGECPANTVFSEHTKQCTKNLSHCVRGNQFHCETSGRFSDLTHQSVYYICVKNKLDSYVRFKFQCQEGYSLNKETVRCIETEPERSISNDNESENENERKRNRYDHRNEQRRERQKDNESENENERKRNRDNHKNEPRSDRENDSESENENERKRNRYHHKSEQRRQRKNYERDSEDEKSESKEFECEEEGKFAHPDSCRQYYKCSKNRKSEYRRRIKSCDSDELFDVSKNKCVDAESYECQRK